MNRRLYISLIILMMSSFLVYGQDIMFQKNVNHSARELTQRLNDNRDSLVLKTKINKIQQVDIFNDDFSEHIEVNDYATKIDLSTLPYGDFIVQAKIDNKFIIMFLKKKNNDAFTSKNLNDFYNNTYAAKRSSNYKEKGKRTVYYWVVSESNSNFGATKSMKLEYKEEVVKLISKHQLELKSEVGKDNKLYVYAIYDKNKFMKKQFRNPDYYKTAESSETFNVEPFYVTKEETPTKTLP